MEDGIRARPSEPPVPVTVPLSVLTPEERSYYRQNYLPFQAGSQPWLQRIQLRHLVTLGGPRVPRFQSLPRPRWTGEGLVHKELREFCLLGPASVSPSLLPVPRKLSDTEGLFGRACPLIRGSGRDWLLLGTSGRLTGWWRLTPAPGVGSTAGRRPRLGPAASSPPAAVRLWARRSGGSPLRTFCKAFVEFSCLSS